MNVSSRLRRLSRLDRLAGTVCIILALAPAPLLAQGGRATINGTVTDATSAAITGAKVKLTNSQTGVVWETQTSTDGIYAIPSVPVGKYTLSVSHKGFATATNSSIELTPDQIASLDFSLKVGSVDETVHVTGGTETLNVTSAALEQVVTEKTILELPLNGRNPAELVFLAPGATNILQTEAGLRQDYTTYPTETGASINGGRQGSTYYLLDGAQSIDHYLLLASPFPNPDATEEFRVITNNFDAQYGFAAGGVVSVVTRSGTNQWHADAFEFLRNDVLNAREYFSQRKDTLKRNQFGGSVGGRIIPEKLFVFGNFQATRERTYSNTGYAFVPNDNQRSGNFSDISIPLHDPAGNPYPSNFIDPSTFDPVAVKLLQDLPHSTDPTGLVRVAGLRYVRDYNEFTGKADYFAGPHHHFSGRSFVADFAQPQQGGGGNFLLADRSWQTRDQNHAFNWSWIFSPTLLSNLVFSYHRVSAHSIPGLVGPDGKPACFPCYGSNIAQYPSGVPGINFLNVDNYFSVGQTSNVITRHEFSFNESVTWTKGHHLLVFGGNAVRANWESLADYLAQGGFDFSGVVTGNAVADFLLGHAYEFQQGSPESQKIHYVDWAMFGQDTIKVKQNLTITAGLRWEPYLPPTPAHGRLADFKPGEQSTRYPNAPVGLVFIGDKGVPSRGSPSQPALFAPRFGIAWQPQALKNTSVRAAVGIFNVPIPFVRYNSSADVAPFGPYWDFTRNDIGGKDISLSDPWTNYAPTNGASPLPPFPSANYVPTQQEARFTSPVGIIFAVDDHFKLGRYQTWNASVEHQFSPSIVARVAYVGSEAYHLMDTIDRNPGIFADGGARTTYPNFQYIFIDESKTTASYNGLQLSFEKKFSKGLQYTTNYTWSKAIDSLSQAWRTVFPNPFDIGWNRGISDLNFPQIWVNYGVYQLPALTGSPALLRSVFGGWQLSGVWRLQSGRPFNIYGGLGDNNSLSGEGSDRADFVPGVVPRTYPGNLAAYFTTAAFTTNASGTFGNTPRNIFQGPGQNNVDLGLGKNFSFGERYRVQFRWEMFNAFNRTQFATPGNTVGSPDFGHILSTSGAPRVMQAGLKLYW